MASRHQARRLSRVLRYLWGWGVTACGWMLLAGCNAEKGVGTVEHGREARVGIGIESPGLGDPYGVWQEAIDWARGPDGDGVIECEVAVEDAWLEALPASESWEGFRFLGGGLGMTGLRAMGRYRPRQLVVREVAWGANELAEIRSWGSVERLDIEFWRGGEGVVFDARGLESLRSLRLAGDSQTRVDWRSMEGLSELKHLHLLGIRVDSDALTSLGFLGNLESLYVDDAGCSADALMELLRSNPDLHLHWDGGHL